MAVPQTIWAGLTLTFTVDNKAPLTSSLYPTATFYIRSATADEGQQVSGSATSTGWTFTATAAATSDWAANLYKWEVDVSDGTNSYIHSYGDLAVRSSLSASSTSALSHARKVLVAIEAVIEKRASQDQMNYTIHGRTLGRTSIPDLLLLRDRYMEEVRREEAAEQLEQGRPGRNRMIVRMP